MEILYSFLAQSAQITPTGCFNVFDGGLDSLQVSALPGVLPSLSVLVKMEFLPEELDIDHFSRIDITKPSGERFAPPGGHPLRTAPNPNGMNLPSVSLLVVQLVIGVESEGEYGIHIVIDGEERKRLPLRITVAPPEAGPSVTHR
jgi:hypothetical protein